MKTATAYVTSKYLRSFLRLKGVHSSKWYSTDQEYVFLMLLALFLACGDADSVIEIEEKLIYV